LLAIIAEFGNDEGELTYDGS